MSEARVIGAAHAGWKGALTGVLEATVDAMEKLGAQRSRIIAAIGPLIRQPNYEVGPEFVAALRHRGRYATHDSSRPPTRAGHAMFDLPGYIASRLERAGIKGVEDLTSAPTRNQRAFSATAVPPIAASRIMAGTSTR